MISGPYAGEEITTGGPGDYTPPGTVDLDAEGRRRLRAAAEGARGLRPGGVPMRLEDSSPDQVTRASRIMAANPGLMITSPKANGSPHYVADSNGATTDGVMVRAHHEDLRTLLDHLVAECGIADA